VYLNHGLAGHRLIRVEQLEAVVQGDRLFRQVVEVDLDLEKRVRCYFSAVRPFCLAMVMYCNKFEGSFLKLP
jgi:hypothetical protein